ncbi:MAG TPA: rhodanese-like domain-containing protein [Kiloniellales bacterium]|nr:rhodanese-like domain-containing protein [Kiloniellales bacterium]
MVETISPQEVRNRLLAGGELAFLDVREAGQFGLGHPLLAVPLPYSRLELEVARLVPRRNAPVVLIDAGDGVADRAARRLEALGYGDVATVEGGAPGWATAGYALFEGVNVPSKALGEHIEHAFETPAISPEDLRERVTRGEKIVLVDARPPAEYRRMTVPGALDCPGAELIRRVPGLVEDETTPVVVHCAGRTRSIVGAQTLIEAGLPNPVVALRNGTQGWSLAGFELARDNAPVLPEVTERGRAFATAAAARLAARHKIPKIPFATLQAWRAEPERTCYLLDVRTEEEYRAGHPAGAVHAPGGQLVQASDAWLGTRGARVVLCDDGAAEGHARATATALWLRTMGWDAAVLDDPEAAERETGVARPAMPALPEGAQWIAPEELSRRLAQDPAEIDVVDVGESAGFRAGHTAGARWLPRPRLGGALRARPSERGLVLVSEDGTLAVLAAYDAQETIEAPAAVLRGGRNAWRAAGFPLESSPDDPPDSERIDFLFWVHDRHAGNKDSMREYLAWEQALPARVAADGTLRFAPPAGAAQSSLRHRKHK